LQIRKTNITQQVIEYLKENIETGTWQVGEKIPSENTLTEMLGVSRSSIRMAIQQFIALNVLESFHGKGTFVKTDRVIGAGSVIDNIAVADYDDIYQVLQFRKIIETEGAYLAAQKTNNIFIDHLRLYLKNMKANIGNSEEFVKQDILFHEEICKAAGNHLLENCLIDVFQKTAKNHKQMNEVFGYKDGIYFHALILKAIENKDAKKAKHWMKEHMQQAIDRLTTS